MEPLFAPDAAVETAQIRDTIHVKINKAKGILTCAMFAIDALKIDPPLKDVSLYYAMWAAEDCVENVADLLKQLEKLASAKTSPNSPDSVVN